MNEKQGWPHHDTSMWISGWKNDSDAPPVVQCASHPPPERAEVHTIYGFFKVTSDKRLSVIHRLHVNIETCNVTPQSFDMLEHFQILPQLDSLQLTMTRPFAKSISNDTALCLKFQAAISQLMSLREVEVSAGCLRICRTVASSGNVAQINHRGLHTRTLQHTHQ